MELAFGKRLVGTFNEALTAVDVYANVVPIEVDASLPSHQIHHRHSLRTTIHVCI